MNIYVPLDGVSNSTVELMWNNKFSSFYIDISAIYETLMRLLQN